MPQLLAFLLVGIGVTSCRVAGDAEVFLDPRIHESSGIVHSREYPGIMWVHSDSGQGNFLFATTISGEMVNIFAVPDAAAVDWEDIAADDEGNLYIGDIGDNFNRRTDLAVLRVREPDPRGDLRRLPIAHRIAFRYPKESGGDRPDFDGESLFWASGRLYLLTKHRSDHKTTLYRFPPPQSDPPLVLERVSEFDLGGKWARFGGMATAADLSPDGKFLAVLTYHALFVFEVPKQGDDFLATLRNRIEFSQQVTQQCEALTWDGAAVVFTNEGGAVYRIEDPLVPRAEPWRNK